uniref:Uncharacterized protein n=1 Tax=Magallana gigas TaxID=29159 RepID=A0A8W8NYJ2_MAGGI
MDLRNGKTTNFQGLLPQTPIPTTPRTPTAPPTVRMQNLMRTTQLLRDTPTNTGAVASSSVTITQTSPSTIPPPILSTSPAITSSSSSSSPSVLPPQEHTRHAPNVIKLSQYHQAEPASQWWALFMAMDAYNAQDDLQHPGTKRFPGRNQRLQHINADGYIAPDAHQVPDMNNALENLSSARNVYQRKL